MEGLKFEYEGATYNVPCMPKKEWRDAWFYYGDCPARLADCQDSMCYCCIYHRGNQKARKAFYYQCFPEEKPAKAEKCCKECANHKPKEASKLTAEVFDRPDCPEWAKWAAVEADGKAFWFSKKPEVFDIEDSEADGFWYCPATRRERIDGRFDASTWKESSIKKPGYTVIKVNNLIGLERIVKEYLAQGWLLKGGAVRGEDFYMQTLIKED